ncbi:hypothetical protein BV25DRAFT_735377 [Artomyces pyxidatus]|uniref:Uncharacterized protein n=1 Tax=Artomyces pyxidatus TaxID=48021 RepID=A0ACB8SYL5_9AGAM|nr:hypothetical protein BV25DRAFT_735377 [Artomyces pyxidatus]
MHRLWNDQGLVKRILTATRYPDPSVLDFVDAVDLSELDSGTLSHLESSYKVHRLQRLTINVNDAEHRNTLAQCALVCRAFCLPAVELLWSRVPCFEALVDLLPSDYKAKRYGESVPVLTRELTPSEVTASKSFLRHQTMVHSLAYCDTHERTTPLTISYLVSSWPYADKVPFPNVTSAVWDVEYAYNLSSVMHFLRPRLQSLELRVKAKSDFTSTPSDILLAVAVNCTNLTSLSLTGSFVFTDSIPAFRKLATNLVHLTDLKLLQEQDWHDFPGQGEASATPVVPETPAFPALQNVTLHGTFYAVFSTLGQLCCYPQQRAHLRLTQAPTVAQVTSLLRRLARSPITLSHIEISLVKHPMFPVGSADDTLTGSAFQSLFRLSRIVHLELHQLGIAVDLSDRDIHQMGVAWPRLHFLALDTHPSPIQRPDWMPTLPLEQLALYAEAFPRLQVLKTPLCAPKREVIADLVHTAVPSASPLWGLNWDVSGIDDEHEDLVLAYLLVVFPCLTLVKRCTSERWDTKNMVIRKGMKMIPARARREWDVRAVASLESDKWAYRSWCL